MHKKRIGKVEIFAPKDPKERDLLAGIVNHFIPPRYNILIETGDVLDHTKFGFIMTLASMKRLFDVDEEPLKGLMALYFRGYVTTNPEHRIYPRFHIEDNNEQHMEKICALVNSHQGDIDDKQLPYMPPGHTWNIAEVAKKPHIFMWAANCVFLSEFRSNRIAWVVI